ncbi:MAG: hypothetical protein CVU24_15075 [Betaproteobacteria bacterium HGW-Betaproteobacteria-18]|nr:MAG: hypothetical protein CVU24_15075 [Betaproteobacteria bacterium HGW-Betaproteobacteria-18]
MVTAKKSGTVAAEAAPKSKAPAKKTVVAPTAAAAPKAALKKFPVKKATASKVQATQATVVRPAVSTEQRHNYIEVAAFYVAQRRGFAPGNPLDDWATAEVEVDVLIASGHFSR